MVVIGQLLGNYMVVIVHFILSAFLPFLASIPLFIRVFQAFFYFVFLYCLFCGLYFGKKYIVLPNTSYGDWESAAYGSKYLSIKERNAIILERLKDKPVAN